MNLSESTAYDRFAAVYDLMMGDRSEYVQFYTGLLNDSTRSVVDVGCGTGVITSAMASRLRDGFRVTKPRIVGVDGSEGMLLDAARRDPSIEWLQCDLRELAVDGSFDLAISCYNTLQHVDGAGLAKAFQAIRGVLHPGSRFAFDIYKPNRSYIRLSQRNRLARTIVRAGQADLEIREDTDFDEHRSLLTIGWRLVAADQADAVPLTETVLRMWQHDPEDVEAALENAGFRMVQRYGDLAMTPYGESSKKQIYVCEAS